MLKTILATAVAALAFTGVASAQTVVHKEVTVQRDHGNMRHDMHRDRMMHHDNGMHRGHAYGHYRHHGRPVIVREEHRRHPMAHRHVSKDVIGRDGQMKHVEKNVHVDQDGNKTVHKVVTK